MVTVMETVGSMLMLHTPVFLKEWNTTVDERMPCPLVLSLYHHHFHRMLCIEADNKVMAGCPLEHSW